jgi:hypothetical protein
MKSTMPTRSLKGFEELRPAGAPTRFQVTPDLLKRYGGKVQLLASFFSKGDQLADDVVEAMAALPRGEGMRMLDAALDHGIRSVPDAPQALRAFFADVDEVPEWVDWKRMRLGATTFQRLGLAIPLVLSGLSLMRGYHSSAAIKPLEFTGQLDKMARRRLAETGRFVIETGQYDALRRHSHGFKTTIRVRIVHAQVRRMLNTSGRWDYAAWGAPINQADLAATNLSFSAALLHGARILGFDFTREEGDALIHLWRYSGHLSGVDPALLVTTEEEGRELGELIHLTQPGPDQGSLALAHALRGVSSQMAEETPLAGPLILLMRKYADGVSRAFIGDEISDDLQLPNKEWKIAAPLTRLAIVSPLEMLRKRMPFGTWTTATFGNALMRALVAYELKGVDADFKPPVNLPFVNRFRLVRTAAPANG